ncbi:hypothetical protein BH10PSE16_BH10PSE16_39650 [soil metagenome]
MTEISAVLAYNPYTGILALTAHCAKTGKKCWDAEKTGNSEILAGLGLEPQVNTKLAQS